MDIDLLFSDRGHAGLIANRNFIKKLAGVLLDTESGLVTLEYTDMDVLELNIPIDPDFLAPLERVQTVYIGAVIDGNIAQAYQVPLMFLDDPYALQNPPAQARTPLRAFEHFIKSCINGQPLHREDLGDEDNSTCVLGDAMPTALQFAPHLARRHALEAAPQTPTPRGPAGPSGPGLGGGGSSGGHVQRSSPPRDADE
jgi:hypothetical protein